MAFKIALTAGHYLGTPGKRCLKSLDPNETREWVLNDRIADKVEKILKEKYTGFELLRTDDTTGKKDMTLSGRTNAANKFGADVYISIHHNAGIKGGDGGGIVAYVHRDADKGTKALQKALYDALIKATGLKGNREAPLATANFHEVRETEMPAVLLELGFMDSKTDVPVILSEEYADQCAEAIVSVLAARYGLATKPKETHLVQVTLDDSEAARELFAELVGRGYAVKLSGHVEEQGIAPKTESIDDIARDVLNGVYGNNPERKQKLVAKYGAEKAVQIQARVNEILGGE